jgi:hypothetical protein
MFAPFLSLAFRAAEESGAIAFPQEMEVPLLSDTDTGTSSPMTPASKSKAPTTMINRRAVTVSLPSNTDPWQVIRCIAQLNPAAGSRFG